MFVKRTWIIHLVMFASSYVIFMSYLYQTKHEQRAIPGSSDVQQVVTRIGSQLASPRPFANNVSSIQSPLAKANATSSPANASLTSNQAPVIPPAEVFVPDYASPQAHVTSLERAAQFDEHAANRLSAISSLRQQAAIGDTDGSIAEAVRAATMDDDADVRSAAQAAYNEIMANKQAR